MSEKLDDLIHALDPTGCRDFVGEEEAKRLITEYTDGQKSNASYEDGHVAVLKDGKYYGYDFEKSCLFSLPDDIDSFERAIITVKQIYGLYDFLKQQESK